MTLWNIVCLCAEVRLRSAAVAKLAVPTNANTIAVLPRYLCMTHSELRAPHVPRERAQRGAVPLQSNFGSESIYNASIRREFPAGVHASSKSFSFSNADRGERGHVTEIGGEDTGAVFH
jgi:hypothetical protein